MKYTRGLKKFFVQSILASFIVLFSSIVSYGKTIMDGHAYLDLNHIAKELGMSLKWPILKEYAVIFNNENEIAVKKEQRQIKINNTVIWLGKSIRFQKNKLYISESDFIGVIEPILRPERYTPLPQLRHIVIDPGHGHRDQGARNEELDVAEKVMTLDVAKRLQKILESEGFRVSLTRNGDEFVALKKRPEIANKMKADLFISIHFNSVTIGKDTVQGIESFALSLKDHPSTSANKLDPGDMEVLVGNKNDQWNSLIGYCVHENLHKTLRAKDRGLRRARFAVLKTLNCPGILIEAGFISHQGECAKIKNPVYRDRIAKSISKGVLEYRDVLNRSRVNNSIPG